MQSTQFSFLFIPILNFVTNSHFHGIPTGLFFIFPFPFPNKSFNRWGINNFWPIEDSSLFVVESKTDHNSQH